MKYHPVFQKTVQMKCQAMLSGKGKKTILNSIHRCFSLEGCRIKKSPMGGGFEELPKIVSQLLMQC